MPLLWRYLLSHFFKTTLVCVLTFVLILLTMRLDEIAHFAALGAPLHYIFLFTLYQIPYILPLALPISCLISSLILIQRLSNTHELTALRACGFSFGTILAPILIAAGFLGILNFWIVSEVATHSHLTTNSLKSELKSINPLLLLHNKHIMRLKGIYFEALGPSRVGESAADVVLAIPNKNSQRLNLVIAQQLKASPIHFIGQGVTLLTTTPAEQESQFDPLFIENMGESITMVEDFSQLLQKNVWTVNNDYLYLSLLLVRIHEQKQALDQARQNSEDPTAIKEIRGQLHRSLSDLSRRLSIAFAAFSFTLMGTTCGISISRQRKNRSLYIAIFFTVIYLMAFFVAKGLDRNWILASSLYLIPHFLIILVSLFFLRRATKGIE